MTDRDSSIIKASAEQDEKSAMTVIKEVLDVLLDGRVIAVVVVGSIIIFLRWLYRKIHPRRNGARRDGEGGDGA